METRVALIGIIIEDTEQVATINELLSEFRTYNRSDGPSLQSQRN